MTDRLSSQKAYEWWRMQVLKAVPNAGHFAIADLVNHVERVTLITQNVDDLRERAGNTSTNQAEAAQHASPYLTIQQFTKKHPAFPLGTLRHQIFYEESNGLKKAGAFVRNWRRVLIREDRYFDWLESQNSGASDEK